jgi:hypothetical protein
MNVAKKRLVIELTEGDHASLMKRARDVGMTAANYVRKALGFPLERQGVKTKRGTAKKPSRKGA